VISLAGCTRKQGTASQPNNRPAAGAYFKTHWKNESQYIVENITADLAEMIFFAKNKRLPAAKDFSVSATEVAAGFQAPVYKLEVKFGEAVAPVSQEVKVTLPIWEPEIYRPLSESLFSAVGLPQDPVRASDKESLELLKSLESFSAEEIEHQNAAVSKELGDDFRNPLLHQKAALLLGAFALREFSGPFCDVRSPLCRMTAHLAMARALAKDSSLTVNGQVAEAILYTLMNNQKDALARLAQLERTQPEAIRWVRALKARNTADYRLIDIDKNPSFLETAAWCYAFSRSVDPSLAWERLVEKGGRKSADFCRIVNSMHYSVGTGHGLLELSLPLELKEVEAVARVGLGPKVTQANLIAELNRLPEHCFSETASGNPQVRVIGWGQWAMFFRRHICHAMVENMDFMYRKWGVPDDAKEFSRKCDQSFAGLRLYPFVRRFNCTDTPSYHRAIDDGFVVTVNTPHLVSPAIWNYLCYTVSFAPLYSPNPNPHVNEWHKHNPPPGTAYNPHPRLNHPSLVNRPDKLAQLERLHELAPFDYDIADYLLRQKYSEKATYEQQEEIFHPVVDYDSYIMSRLAKVASPADYERLMLKATESNPYYYFSLGETFEQKDPAKAATYLEKGIRLCSDSVAGSGRAGWLIRYYQKNGQAKKAELLADWAAETYSYAGLKAKAEFLESAGRYSEAFDYCTKIKERYDKDADLLCFCRRYKTKTGDTRYDELLRKSLQQLFPNGLEKAVLADFTSAPSDGVIIREENELIKKAGLETGDIIVAVYGIKVHNFEQYDFGRDSNPGSEMDLIVWKKNRYLSVKASPPEHRFNATFKTFHRHA